MGQASNQEDNGWRLNNSRSKSTDTWLHLQTRIQLSIISFSSNHNYHFSPKHTENRSSVPRGSQQNPPSSSINDCSSSDSSPFLLRHQPPHLAVVETSLLLIRFPFRSVSSYNFIDLPFCYINCSCLLHS